MESLIAIIVAAILGAGFFGAVGAVCLYLNACHKRETQTLRMNNTEMIMAESERLRVMDEIHERDSKMIRDGFVPAQLTIESAARKRLRP